MSDCFASPWTVAHQAPLSVGFSRQEYWSELPFPSPGALPDPGIEFVFHVSCTDRWDLYHQGHLGSPWLQDDSSALHVCALYFYCYYISSSSDITSWRLGTPALKFLGRNPSLLLPSFRGLLVILGVTWLVAASPQPLSPSSRDFLLCASSGFEYSNHSLLFFGIKSLDVRTTLIKDEK